ncbi:MAG: hypothetical protein ACK4I0_11830 [Brevundimonas sp.]|uniref:hypothetical protein n=1 Tax=Brevundimonas sp. TaxID=1871086 RepID=UPI00391CF07B
MRLSDEFLGCRCGGLLLLSAPLPLFPAIGAIASDATWQNLFGARPGGGVVLIGPVLSSGAERREDDEACSERGADPGAGE